MEKHFNNISMFFGILGGFIANYLGGMDTILHAIIFLVVIDYFTGLAKAWKQKKISSEIGFVGLLRKIMIFIVIAVAVEIEKLVNNSIPLREIVIMFYIANEGISVFENIAEFIPLPEKLTDYFIQIREDKSGSEKNDKGN